MNGPALELFNVLLNILTGVCALARSRGSRDLELAVVGYLELSELLNETVLVLVVDVAGKSGLIR